ncbi:hypothetical protein GCM10010171_63880 [Actinokineospora fastidiosa]|uniref:Uncharacterized protein n=1 Tax=Actinokineospora fastidiosa TaxID=1816 RepID=A0A918LK79_9PSEU|nr:hypothetical protein GCM10010171_63880 [Actinokineospora fastidiosa]
MRRHCLVLLTGTTLLLAGCGDRSIPDLFAAHADTQTTPPPQPTTRPWTTPTSTDPTTSEPTTQSTTAQPTTTKPTTTAAAPDGIRVAEGGAVPIPAGTGVGGVRVQSIDGARVTLAGESTGNSFRGACLQSCTMSAHNTAFTVELGQSGGTILNNLRIDLLGVDGGAAVLDVAKV